MSIDWNIRNCVELDHPIEKIVLPNSKNTIFKCCKCNKQESMSPEDVNEFVKLFAENEDVKHV
jgi:hypothetical protein